ncbi:hypothetical protein LO763_22200 [Glycomyces sp. A-F 0318]|uniref:hypothetical protein n=1 Tax=Glycomyces amatae TaxID=2881355 RepID=UPI001E416B89|nr:hypothetical protein [Glycomyces amatae]MCD0446330.1 hypothetical protein [Glycomyces amatae]
MTASTPGLAPPTVMQPAAFGSLTVRDLALWAYHRGFARCRYTANAQRRRWTFASHTAYGRIIITHQPHLPYPWTVELEAGLERIELVDPDPSRVLIATHLLGVGDPKPIF